MQSEAVLMTCGLCCIWPALIGFGCFYLGRNWGRIKLQSPLVVNQGAKQAPKQGASAPRDSIGYGRAKVD